MTNRNWTKITFWIVFLSLMASLLSHTAWAFSQFEPASTSGDIPALAWVAAFAFEAAIAAIVHRLSQHLAEVKPYTGEKFRLKLARTWERWASPYTFALLVVGVVSSLANTAHAVEFGADMKIFDVWSVPSEVYIVAFGTTLPLVSMFFAVLLSRENESDAGANTELIETKAELSATKLKLTRTESKFTEYMNRTKSVQSLFSGDKKERIKVLHQLAPRASNKAIAEISGASPGHVSETLAALKNNGVRPAGTQPGLIQGHNDRVGGKE